MGIDHTTLPMDSEEYWQRQFQQDPQEVLLRRLEALEGRVNRLEAALPGPDGTP
jgi:hypothetical protein